MPSILTLLGSPEPPHMTMKARPGTLSIPQIDEQLCDAFRFDAPQQTRDLARAAAYLWHDHFDASHSIAQDIENPHGSLLHGILHRREPDYMNARYWFRRVGSHPSFECLVGKIKVALVTSDFELSATQIIPNDKWNPMSFVDLLESNKRCEEPQFDALLRRIQAAEIQCFVQSLPTR